MSQVIFLNGASSAGKTSIGRALQETLPEPHLLLGLDTCFGTVPAPWASAGAKRHEGFAYVDLPSQGGQPMLGITYGEVGWRIMAGFHRAVAELVHAGNAVVIDEMLLDERVRDDWLDVLAPLNPFLVGVRCDVEELARREARRTGRPGLARWAAGQVHAGMAYDLVVDTTHATPDECAARVRRSRGR